MPCSIWREAADNVAESLTRGARVIVSGRLKQRSWQTPEGDKRSRVELEVDEIGPSLRFATAQVNRTSRGGTGGFGEKRDRSRDLVGAATGSRGGDDNPWATTFPARSLRRIGLPPRSIALRRVRRPAAQPRAGLTYACACVRHGAELFPRQNRTQ